MRIAPALYGLAVLLLGLRVTAMRIIGGPGSRFAYDSGVAYQVDRIDRERLSQRRP